MRLVGSVAIIGRELLSCPRCEFQRELINDLYDNRKKEIELWERFKDETNGVLQTRIDQLERDLESKDTTIAYYRNILHSKFGLTDSVPPKGNVSAEQTKIRGPVHLSRDLSAIQRMVQNRNEGAIKDRAEYWRKKNAEAEAKETTVEKLKQESGETDEVEILDLENIPSL